MSEPDHRLSFESSISARADISSADADALFQIAEKKQYKKAEFLLREGQVCKKLVLVQKGVLRSFMNKDGREINTGFAFEGDFAADILSLRHGAGSQTSIQALEPATVYEFEKEKLFALYELSPGISSFGRRVLEHLLSAQEEQAVLFRITTPAERYTYIARHKPGLLQRISLSQLASYLGVARETLSRIRKITLR